MAPVQPIAIIGIRHVPLAAGDKCYVSFATRRKGRADVFCCGARVSCWPIATLRGSAVFGRFREQSGHQPTGGNRELRRKRHARCTGHGRCSRMLPSRIAPRTIRASSSLFTRRPLTCVPIPVTLASSLIEGRGAEAHRVMGARAVPAGGFAACSRAAWVSVSRHDDRGGRCIPGLGQAKAGNARSDRVPGSLA